MLDQPQATEPDTPRYVHIPADAESVSAPAPDTRASARDFEALRDMTRLLRADLSRDERLLRTLELAATLLPEARRVRIFLSAERVAGAFEVFEPGAASRQMTQTLGYGDATEREVLRQHHSVQQPYASLVPLPGPPAEVPAILAVDWRQRTPGDQSDTRMLLLAEQLAALLSISERDQHAKQLAATLEQQSQAFDAFVSMTAHELRSPLTSIKGYAQLLVRQAQRSGLPEAALHSAEAIVEQGTRLAGMIEQIHDAARIRRDTLEMHFAPTDLVALVREQAEQWPTAFPRHTIQLKVMDGSLVGRWDAYRVAQVIQNLLENAARYSAGESGIVVEIERQSEMAVVAVRDQGVGIPEQDQAHVFEYLYRSPAAVARNLTGLGLGLFVSSQLVEHMGGQIWLQHSSTGPESGSEFRFTLPLAA